MLCLSAGATRQGEHVLPKWYFGSLDPGPGPLPWTKSGEPIRDREGRPVVLQERVRVQLPVCERCNGEMDRRFEKPAKEVLRRLFHARGAVDLDGGELESVALWLLKTLLLLARPEVRYSAHRVNDAAVRWTTKELPNKRFYDWLIDGSAAPEGLSVWLFRTDEARDDLPPPEYRMPLPDVRADGSTTEFVSLQLTFHGISVTVVVHPGWAILHPLEEDGRALRLWPDPPPQGGNLEALPILPPNTVTWMRCRVHLKPGVLWTPQLPPLTYAMNPFLAPQEWWRFAESWGM